MNKIVFVALSDNAGWLALMGLDGVEGSWNVQKRTWSQDKGGLELKSDNVFY